MSAYTDTRLWKSTLAQQSNDPYQSAREKLRSSFLKFRERAALLADEIKRDLPEFTVHGATHLDALWEMADIVVADKFQLTPAEAYVLGGAFLIHDTGMALAAYPEGPIALRQDQNWPDIATSILRKNLGRRPNKAELSKLDRELELEVIAELLRLRHAKQAKKLATTYWKDPDNNIYHLIEDLELRNIYGEIIGLIAHSHWWNIEQVKEEFSGLPLLGAPANIGCPLDWQVDQLKIACLLRIADAIHLDGRRAPGFLRALRKPSNYADLHWKFQNRVTKPALNNDRLVFTSSSFQLGDFLAWWVGYDLLQNADRELRQVDNLLLDLQRSYRFAAHSIAGMESPERLPKYIRTEGWMPINAQIRVSDVAALIKTLGGEELYGRDVSVPLRELIQNASDAVRARRTLTNKGENWGDVVVRIGKDETGDWIEVEDTGVGMSTAVLTGPFLDFGRSFWGTGKVHEEWPGLEGKGFESTGKYGIGFFSVFMWGNHVRITTHRYKDALADTIILEFTTGLDQRPILKRASESEYLSDGGTCVRVWLNKPFEDMFSRYVNKNSSFKNLLTELCPCLDANLYLEQESDGRQQVVAASDWKTMNPRDLCRRIYVNTDDDNFDRHFQQKLKVADNYRPLKGSDGDIIGMASLEIRPGQSEFSGLVTIGGFYADRTSYVAGVLAGNPVRASRDEAIPEVSVEELKSWATQQAELAHHCYHKPGELIEFAAYVRGCGGDTRNLPIAAVSKTWMSFEQIANRNDWPNEILIASASDISRSWREEEKFELYDGVFATLMDWRHPEVYGLNKTKTIWPLLPSPSDNELFNDHLYYTLKLALIEAIASAWGCSLIEVLGANASTILDHSDYRSENLYKENIRKVGELNGRDWEYPVDVIRNPHSIREGE